jgi:hypothetical protein
MELQALVKDAQWRVLAHITTKQFDPCCEGSQSTSSHGQPHHKILSPYDEGPQSASIYLFYQRPGRCPWQEERRDSLVVFRTHNVDPHESTLLDNKPREAYKISSKTRLAIQKLVSCFVSKKRQ